ncbi:MULTISPECIES: hypothetical protein [unclassified Streptomyces]|nr:MULTISPECIES: hypothetical protein [unclassified Streptomyces]MYR27779.1 hypothetical protein [Streptomyces sp. SID4945]SCF29269.1 hypothetical protein GA0115257_11032 [Streptomyces sp. LcepLS]
MGTLRSLDPTATIPHTDDGVVAAYHLINTMPVTEYGTVFDLLVEPGWR